MKVIHSCLGNTSNTSIGRSRQPSNCGKSQGKGPSTKQSGDLEQLVNQKWTCYHLPHKYKSYNSTPAMLQLWWPGKHLASHESKLHSLNSGCLVCTGTTLENQRAEHSYRSFRLHSETQRPGTRSEEAVQQQHEHSVTPPLFPLLQSCDSPLNGTERKVASSTLMMLKLENSTVLCDSEGIS